MKIRLLAVGHRMPDWVQQGFEEYQRRLPRDCSLELVEINPARRGKNAGPPQWIREEGQNMLQQMRPGNRVIALEVRGAAWSTPKLAQQLENWKLSGSDIELLVGGPDGLCQNCVSRADQLWSLSPLTLPHPLVRVILAEQLYRAWSITQGHPYHRE